VVNPVEWQTAALQLFQALANLVILGLAPDDFALFLIELAEVGKFLRGQNLRLHSLRGVFHVAFHFSYILRWVNTLIVVGVLNVERVLRRVHFDPAVVRQWLLEVRRVLSHRGWVKTYLFIAYPTVCVKELKPQEVKICY
jgi:hypothetical protein